MIRSFLGQCSTLTALERHAEAERILILLGRASNKNYIEKEAEFIEKCKDPGVYITTKMLFWLRDLKDKYAT